MATRKIIEQGKLKCLVECLQQMLLMPKTMKTGLLPKRFATFLSFSLQVRMQILTAQLGFLIQEWTMRDLKGGFFTMASHRLSLDWSRLLHGVTFRKVRKTKWTHCVPFMWLSDTRFIRELTGGRRKIFYLRNCCGHNRTASMKHA